MSLSVRKNKFKLYMEGVHIENWESVGISTSVGGGLSGNVSIPDDGIFFINFVPGTKISIFSKNQPYVDGYENKKDGYFLLVEGVANAISRSNGRGDHGRTLSIAFQGWSFFSKRATYFSYVPSNIVGDAKIFSREVVDEVKKRGLSGKKIDSKEYRRKYWDSFQEPKPIKPEYDIKFGDGQGYENFLGSLYFYYAYIKTTSLESGVNVDGEGKSKNKRITRNIFESAQLRKKVFVASDKDTDKVTKITEALNGGHWWKYALLSKLSYAGNYDKFFNILSWFLVNGDHQMIENIAPSMVGTSSMNSVFFKQKLPFSIPPLSNVIMPSDITSMSEYRDYGSEPTHILSVIPKVKEDVGTGSEGTANAAFKKATYGTNRKRIDKVSLNVRHQESIEVFDSYAELIGVNMRIVEDNSYSNFLLNSTIKRDGTIDKVFEDRMDREEIEYKFMNRRSSVNTSFMPFLMCGFSAVILDKDYLTIGNMESITHSLSPTSASTNIQLSHARFSSYDKNGSGDSPDEYFDFYGTEYKGEKIKEIYSKYYGTSSINRGESIGGEEPSEMDDRIREICTKILADHDKNETGDVLDFSDAMRSRRFVSEEDYFKIMKATKTTIVGVYESKSIKSLDADGGSVFPFISEKQIPILDYVVNIKNKINLGK